MAKIICNELDDFVKECYQGFGRIQRKYITRLPDMNAFVRNTPKEKGKVKIVLMGGAGHEPGCGALVRYGLGDMCVIGNLFVAPGSGEILKALRYLNDGSPILLVLSNHFGDCYNSGIACDVAGREGIPVTRMIICDDVSSAPVELEEERRGLTGTLLILKMIGAAAEEGADLEEVRRIGEKAKKGTGTFAMSLSGCYNPLVDRETIILGEDEVELGVGMHGEGGNRRVRVRTAREYAEIIMDALTGSKDLEEKEILLLLNGMGGITYQEMCILYNDLYESCRRRRIHVMDEMVGNFGTTLNMHGVAVSICRVDEELKRLWKMECDSSFFH